MAIPHSDDQIFAVACAVLTISDTRTVETDHSGRIIHQQLAAAGHIVRDYLILPDEPEQIQPQVQTWVRNPAIQVCLLNGGTGIAPRDTTYEAIAGLLQQTLPGFGELFRMLSYAEIGSRAMASRAIAGVCEQTLIFAMPGSSNAVRLAMTTLVLPELVHLTKQLNN